MSVQEIETAITQLSSPELARLAAWFEEYQADLWDQQIEKMYWPDGSMRWRRGLTKSLRRGDAARSELSCLTTFWAD